MTKSTIYTIEREFGSGGHLVGEMLAKQLGIPFYDSQIVDLAAKRAGMSKKLFESLDEKPSSSLLYSFVVSAFAGNSPMTNITDFNMSDKLFIEESKIIREAAEEGPCVIVGRCASYILRERKDVMHIFITADMDYRMGRARLELPDIVSDSRLKDEIFKRDKKRSSYYNYYTGKQWDSASCYDLTVSTSAVGNEGAVQTILDYGTRMENKRTRL